MYRLVTLLVASLTLPGAGQELWIGHLTSEQLVLELAPLKQNATKEIALSISMEKSAESRLAKLLDLEKKGYASHQRVAAQERHLAATRDRRQLWEIYHRALTQALRESAVARPSASARSETLEARVQIPGVTQRFGNIDLFTLIARPDHDQLESAIAYLQARQVPTQLGQQLAAVDQVFLSDLGKAIDELESPFASDFGRFQARAFHAASNYFASATVVAQLDRDANRIRDLQASLDSGTAAHFPWLSQPLGLVGTGWRCAASPTPNGIALCLPLAEAMRDQSGQIRIGEAQLALAEHRLSVKREARERQVGTDLEVEGARVERVIAQALLDAGHANAIGNQLRYEQLVALASEPFHPAPRPLPESLDEIEAVALAQLPDLIDQPAFVYGWLKNLESWLAAQLQLKTAQRTLAFHETYRDQIHDLRKTTANERQRVRLQASYAAATHHFAEESVRLRFLEFSQWIQAAALARQPISESGPQIPDLALKQAANISRTKESVLRALHVQHAASFRFQSQYVAKLEQVQKRGAATEYELAQSRSRLEMARGNLEALQPSMDLVSLEQSLQQVIGGTPGIREVEDLDPLANRLLAQIAGTRQRPNSGSLLVMEAMGAFTERRAEKMAPLVEKGFATSLELAEVERNGETYRLIAASERNRELAVSPAEALVGKPRPLQPQPLRQLSFPPLEFGSQALQIETPSSPFAEVARKKVVHESSSE